MHPRRGTPAGDGTMLDRGALRGTAAEAEMRCSASCSRSRSHERLRPAAPARRCRSLSGPPGTASTSSSAHAATRCCDDLCPLSARGDADRERGLRCRSGRGRRSQFRSIPPPGACSSTWVKRSKRSPENGEYSTDDLPLLVPASARAVAQRTSAAAMGVRRDDRAVTSCAAPCSNGDSTSDQRWRTRPRQGAPADRLGDDRRSHPLPDLRSWNAAALWRLVAGPAREVRTQVL